MQAELHQRLRAVGEAATFPARRPVPGLRILPGPTRWLTRYRHGVRITDLAVVVAALLLAQSIRFGFGADGLLVGVGRFGLPGIVTVMAVAAVWSVALAATQAYDRYVLGAGTAEYTRVLRAGFGAAGAVAVVDLVTEAWVSRGFLLAGFGIGIPALMLSRWLWRQYIVAARKRGHCLNRVLVLGDTASSVPLIKRLTTRPELGYEVAGICVPARSVAAAAAQLVVDDTSIPVLGDFGDSRAAVSRCGAAVVAVTSGDALGHDALRELSWDLEGLDVEMLVAPAVIDVSGPRITMRPESGLALLHIDKPRYRGANRFLKSAFDRTVAGLLLLMLAPVLIACALAVKIGSAGPVLYGGERIGLDNKPFRMWKFRSMVVGADRQRSSLAGSDDGNGILFKLHDDPRVTGTGRYLRRYSLDELPQLFNVLSGSMSLVGPRPPLREEVDRYDEHVTRRMLVRPGITGLWQVSGRSDLTWEESVRLDLSYVENWSVALDIVILCRTARAVLSKSGAY